MASFWLHPLAERADRLFAPVPQLEEAQQRSIRSARTAPRQPWSRPKKSRFWTAESLSYRPGVSVSMPIRRADLVGASAHHVEAVDPGVPGRRFDERRKEADRRRLARPVGPQEPEHLARCHLEADVPQRPGIAEAPPEALEAEHGSAAGADQLDHRPSLPCDPGRGAPSGAPRS